MKKCIFCSLSLNQNDTLLKEYKNWILLLHKNQEYLGRTILLLREHKTDLSELDPVEQQELFNILKKLKTIYENKFEASKINYAVLGNEVDHLHFHLIPRYQKSHKINGYIFKDEKYGSNPYPYNKSFNIPEEVFEIIKHKIESDLK